MSVSGRLVKMLITLERIKFCIQMHVNIISPLTSVIAFLMDEGLLSIISTNAYLLNRMAYLDQILHTYLF